MFLKPASVPQPEPSLLSYTPCYLWLHHWQSSHIGGRQARGIRRCEEVTEAILWQVPVFIIVEGLSWKLAEEVGTVPEATGAMSSIQGTVRGRQGLRAAAAAHAAVDTMDKSVFEQRKGYQIMTHSSVLVCVFSKNLNHSLVCFTLSFFPFQTFFQKCNLSFRVCKLLIIIS